MSFGNSPLRYPGGKQILARAMARLMELNSIRDGVYAEPYAGGAGAALTLLYGEEVRRIMINDADVRIHAFWRAVLERTAEFIDLIRSVPLTDDEWCRQRRIYQHVGRASFVKRGFATFYLNRCNRSGIIASGGPIGGREQKGKWKIDARFNREELIRRVERVAMYRDRITLSADDAIAFVRNRIVAAGLETRTFVYLDPPYYGKGRDLYLNYYNPDDHKQLASFIRRRVRLRWAMTYDNVSEIRALYAGLRQVPFDLSYSATERRTGKELLISHPRLEFPAEWGLGLPPEWVTSAARLKTSA